MKQIIFVALILLTSKAFGFGGELHIRLTEEALLPYGFSPAVANQIGIANDHVDKMEPLNNPSHVDSETFEAASALMRSRLQQAAEFLLSGDLTKARDTFGYITHTVQDFFSHSNYVEIMPGEPIDLLNLTNPLPSVTCSKKDRRNGLTTGYFPDENTPAGKCSHQDLNKDGGMIYVPHYQAARYARKETARMYEKFEAQVLQLTANPEITKHLLHKFKDGDNAANVYNSDNGETARAMVKVYPNPQKKGEDVTVVFSSEQYCEDFQVDVIDLLGRIVGQGSPYLYKGPMDRNESRTITLNTYHLAPAMYLLRAEFRKCENNGEGNQVFKFIILD